MHLDVSVGIVVVGIHTSSYVMRCNRLPTPGEYLIARRYGKSLDGGKASNQALAAARLGAVSYLVIRVGNDEEGRFAANYLSSSGVNVDYVTTSESLPTGIGIAFMDESGVPMGATELGANAELTEEHINLALPAFKKSKILLTQLEIPVDLALYACEMGKRNNLTVILNPAPADSLSASQLKNIDVLTPNEPEAKIIAGYAPDEDISMETLGRHLYKKTGIKHIVITLGERGALLVSEGMTSHVTCPAIKSVDTSGAGDCFNGALAFALGNGLSMEKAVEFGVRSASLSVTKFEVWPSYPTLQEVKDL
jgi:ribokinase